LPKQEKDMLIEEASKEKGKSGNDAGRVWVHIGPWITYHGISCMRIKYRHCFEI